MAAEYDVIVIGGGHNGLVAAALLAREGQKVLVLEQKADLGGRLAGWAPFPGFAASPCFDDAGRLRPGVESALGLARRGLRWRATDPWVLAPFPEKEKGSLTLWRDVAATRAEIGRLSSRDAERWPKYVKFMNKATRFAEAIFDTAPPELATSDPSQLLEAGRLGLRFRLMGRADMVQMMRLATMTMADWLDEWFETPLLKAALAAPALLGGHVGPHAPATAGLLAYRYAAGIGDLAVGGTASIVRALADACREAGVEVRTQSEVNAIETREGRACGVRLADGTVIGAPVVIADADPRRAVLDMLPPGSVPAAFLHGVRNVRSRGLVARMFIRMRELPRLACLDGQGTARLGGRIHFGPSLRYIEEAFDDAKYGRWSRKPVVEMWIPSLADPSAAPQGEHLLSLTVASAPYALREGTWDSERAGLAEHVVDMLADYIPNLRSAMVEHVMLTPPDLEAQFGLGGGHLHHGELALDQLFVTRPTGEAPRYETPLPGFFLTGGGTHPGGAATGAAGALCAQEVDQHGEGESGHRARNRRIVTTAVGVGLALLGAGLAARGAIKKLDTAAAAAADEGGQA